MIAEIIGVGAALAEDGALAANTRLLEKELGTCGIEVGASAAVGTSVQSLRAAIARALGRSDVVILMGGLGPGPDGIAKETVCEGLSRRLVMHEPSLKRMKEAYERAGRQMPQQVARLAMMPEQSVVFPGVRGVTPGCALSAGNQFLLMVPEDPREFVPMFQHSVSPIWRSFPTPPS
ncbi:MAG: molybdopterin-binding protein [Anaerotruncus massiliensis (ex Togo et al. 2019)]